MISKLQKRLKLNKIGGHRGESIHYNLNKKLRYENPHNQLFAISAIEIGHFTRYN